MLSPTKSDKKLTNAIQDTSPVMLSFKSPFNQSSKRFGPNPIPQFSPRNNQTFIKDEPEVFIVGPAQDSEK